MGHPGIVLSGFKVLLKKDLAKDRKLVTWAVWFDGKIGSPDLLYGSIAKFDVMYKRASSAPVLTYRTFGTGFDIFDK